MFGLQDRRITYADALNKALEIFVTYSENAINDVISNGLRPIAEVAGLDRIIVFRVVGIESDTAGEIYRWDKVTGGTAPLDSSLKILPVTTALKRWISIVSNDTCISLRRSEFSKDEAAFLTPRGVKSILIVPVFTEHEFWGVVTFQDNTNERDFDEDCIGLLRSTARLCTTTIIREEKTRAVYESAEVLKRRKELADILNKTAVLFLSQSGKSFVNMMSEGIKLIVDLVNIDRFSIFQYIATPNDSHSSQLYRWERASGGTTKPNSAFVNVTFRQHAPSWESIFVEGKTVNGPVRLMPEHEAATLKAVGAVSVFVAPVFINNDFWGFALFEDHHNERYFEDDYAELLRSAAFLFTNAFIRAEMEHEVASKNELLSTLNSISTIMLKSDSVSFEKDLLLSMGIMAGLAGADRVYIWKNYIKEGRLYCSQIYEWSEGAESQQNYELAIETLYSDIVPEWEELLSKGQCIKGVVREMSENEKAALVPQGILSILVVPVFLQNQFWGFVGFDDCHNERMFSDNEEMILRSASQLFVNALIRTEMEQEITRAEVLKQTHSENERYKTMAHWYESILDAIPFLVTAQDMNKNCTFINAIAETSFGKKRDEIVGKPCSNLELSICNTENCAIECAKRDRMRTHFLHKNDSYQVDTKLLKNLSGNAIGYIEVIQDITKMEYLSKLQAEAEAASDAKTAFLSVMSHEMRTPMNAIIGMAAIGKNATNLERKDYALNKIEDASTHLLGIINNVLDMSKIEANKLELSYVTFDLIKILQKVVSFLQFSIDKKRILFSLNVDESMPSILIGDEQRLTQILINLLSNAVKFTHEDGSISLDVFFQGKEGKICELRFEVADSGIGISPEQHEKIFNAFEQAESGITRKFGGTGLGLGITKRLIELMGGRIWVESELGKGAIFIFTIKLLSDIKDYFPQSGEEPLPGISALDSGFDDMGDVPIEEMYSEFKDKKLLVVEDIEINREILVSLLDDTGLIVDTAENGREALDMVLADPEKYDLVLMDMQMPEMDGLEATKRIRAFEKQYNEKSEFPKRIPVIAMTANVFQEDIDKCHAAGMDDHIGKPLDIGKLLEKLRMYL